MANIFQDKLNQFGNYLLKISSPSKSLPGGNLNPPPVKTNDSGIPKGRQSTPSYNRNFGQFFSTLQNEYKVVDVPFQRDIIPLIRKLVMVNPNFGQALQNIVFLGNTGHKIHFDRNLPETKREKMQNHLRNKHKQWASGQAGIDGMVNRMFSQVMIGGALSNEWVPNNDLTGIEANIMVNPEDIVYILNDRKTIYLPFQRIHIGTGINSIITTDPTNLIPLNPRTYQYYALNGDGEVPYGFPPYMAALDSLDTQENMNKNINHVVNKLGLLGFLEALIDLPDQFDDETDIAYASRLDARLSAAKIQVEEGFKTGTIVGFKDQHAFQFHSISKDFDKVVELYKQNELQFFSGLKQDATLAGRDYNTSESQITVIFMKMLAELKNVQNLIKCNLEFGYTLELRLAGFQFDYLTVEFNKSTIQDDLKYQQAREYKIKNLTSEYLLGIVNTTQIAHELERETPDQPTPRIPDEALAGIKGQEDQNSDNGATDPAKDSKNKSAKKQRGKAKPQGSKKS